MRTLTDQMKSLRHFISATLAIVTLGSCSTEVDETIVNSIPSTYITASVEGDNLTRTAVKEGTPKTIVWAEGDVFKVFNETTPGSPAILTLTNGAGTSNGTFGGAFVDGNTYAKAAYPSEGASLSADFKTLTMVLPASIAWGTQTTSSDNAVKCPIPFYGTYDKDNASVNFKFLTAIIKLDFKDIPLGTDKVTVESKSQPISGSFTAKTTVSTPQLSWPTGTAVEDANKKLEVTFEATTEAKSNKVLYIAIPAATYEKLDVYLEGTNGTSFKKNIATWENITFARKNIYTASRTYVEISAGTPQQVTSQLSSLTSGLSSGQNVELNVISANSDKGIEPETGNENKIEVPQLEGVNISLSFDKAPVTSDEKPLQFVEKEGGSATSNGLTVAMPDASNVSLEINLPKSTVTLESSGSTGITYRTITAKTATNTLKIGSGVTIEQLTITGGNVDILNGGTVTNMKLPNNSTVKSSDKKGVLTNLTTGAAVNIEGITVQNLSMTAESNTITLSGASSGKVTKLTVSNTGGYTLTKTGSYPTISELVDGDGAWLSVLDAVLSNSSAAYTIQHDLTINANKTISKAIYKSGTLINNGTISNLDNQSGSVLNLNYESGFTGKITKVSGGEVNISYKTENSSDLSKITSAHGTFTLGNDLSISGVSYPIAPVTDASILNLNGKALSSTNTKTATFYVRYSNLTIQDTEGGSINSQSRVVWANESSASVTIKGGTFTSALSECIYCYQGTITIEGGTFISNATDKRYLLNCYDANRNNKDMNQNTGKAKIIVKGGKFYDFNPADNAAEGTGTNFVATGYTVQQSTEGEHTVYTVVSNL